MIIQRSQNNTALLCSPPPSFTFLSSTFLFNLLCFFFPIYVKESFYNLLDTKVNPNCLLFSEREREIERKRESGREGERRESPSSVVNGVVGWCDGTGYTNLDNSRARAYCACSRCEWSLFGHFYSRPSFLFFFSVFWETGRYRLKYCQKGPLNPKQPINQIQSSPVYIVGAN